MSFTSKESQIYSLEYEISVDQDGSLDIGFENCKAIDNRSLSSKFFHKWKKGFQSKQENSHEHSNENMSFSSKSSQDQKIQQLIITLSELQQKNIELRQRLKQKGDELERIQSSLQRSSYDESELSKRLFDIKSRTEKLNQQHTESVQKHQEEIEQLRLELSLREKEKSSITAKMENELAEALQSTKDHQEFIDSVLNQSKIEIAREKEKAFQAKKVVKNLEDFLNGQEIKLQELRDQKSDLELKLKEYQRHEKQLSEKGRNFRLDLTGKEQRFIQKIKELENEIQQYSQKLKQLTRLSESKQAEVNRLENEIAQQMNIAKKMRSRFFHQPQDSKFTLN